MTLNTTTRLAYKDCYDLMDRALQAEKGIRVKFPDKSKAMYQRLRIHNARRIDREDNREVYVNEPDHPLYGRSPYDVLVVRLHENGQDEWYLVIEQSDKVEFEIEELEV